MGGSRFLYGDVADPESGASIFTGSSIPGGYSTAAAVTGYSIASALHHDRYTLAKVTGTNCVIDIDLGDVQNVEALGLMNVYLDSGSYPQVHLWSSPDDSTWTSHGEMFEASGWVGLTNRVKYLGSCFARRYWRIQFTTGTAFYLGKIMLGRWFDFGDLYSPGSIYRKQPPFSRIETASGLPLTHVFGGVRERFVNIHNVIPQEFADVVAAMSASMKPFAYVHGIDDAARHVELTNPPELTHIATGENHYNTTLEMESLP